MSITAKDVNALRKQTGAGMMDCKKALVASEGDMESAVDFLRKKGQKIAAKRGDRDAAEGLIIAKTSKDGNKGVLICLNCETDFVAKNSDFKSLAETIAKIATEQSSILLDELLLSSFNNDITIAEKITEQSGVIGEKIETKGYEIIEAPCVVAYNHPGNQIASIVGLTKEARDEGLQVAMQIAAMNPIAVDKDSVCKEVIDKEIEVGKELAIQEGKPEELAGKIALGRLNKFFKETTLLNQAFVRDNKKTVKQFLNEVSPGLTVTDFKRISLSI